MDSNEPGVHLQHALAVYAESLAAGARVAVFGDASVGLGARLAELGARAVHLWDPDAGRAQSEADRAPRGVMVRAYAEQEADVRPIDLAIVSDLGLFDDPSAIVRRVRRMVGEEGVAVIVAPNAEAVRASGPEVRSNAFDYYDLFDLVAPEFESVRMVAQLPFHGVALVELGEEDEAPGVNVDTQLAESGRAPDAFVVVASQRGARLEPYTIVQLAAAPGVVEPVVLDDTARHRRDREDERAAIDSARAADRDALLQAQLRTELLTGQLDDLRRRLAGSERAAETVASLEESLRSRTAQAQELEASFAARGRELLDLSAEVEEMRSAAEAGRIAAAQVEEVALRSDRAERRVAILEQELAKGGDTQSKELADMEQVLRERAQAVRSLEVEVARRDQIVRDLVDTLEDVEGRQVPAAPETSPDDAKGEATTLVAEATQALGEENARLRAQLDALALDLARREGEAQAMVWQVTELERRLAQAAEPSAPAPPGQGTDSRLAQALDQLDALRVALAQEHDARVRAESGEELSRAHAEIQRQAVMMEQLVRELGSRPPPEGDARGPRERDATGVQSADPASGSSEDSR
jgi:hypothetical protein